MDKIKAIYLLIFKGYSVVRFTDHRGGEYYQAFDSPLSYNYKHDGLCGFGDTACEAILCCYRLSEYSIKNKWTDDKEYKPMTLSESVNNLSKAVEELKSSLYELLRFDKILSWLSNKIK